MESEGQKGGYGVDGGEPKRSSTLDRALKRFCPDFAPIRQTLRNVGARLVSQTEQTDLFFFLPGPPAGEESRRLKLRMEDGRPSCVYHYDRNTLRQTPGTGTVNFQKFEVSDPVIMEVLETALGVRKTVRKHRETWCKGPTIFNLDHVEGVGRILEMEIEPLAQERGVLRPAEFLELFDPHLGAEIAGSNEDLIPDERPWEGTDT